MALKTLRFVLLLACIVVSALGQNEGPDPPVSLDTSTAEPPVTSPPTAEPTTLTSKPTDSTTPKPTDPTTPKPTDPTTPIPTDPPTTTQAPITTQAPAPSGPETGNWTINNGTVTCIVAKFATEIEVEYQNVTSKKMVKGKLFVPKTATTDGSTCQDTSNNQILKLSFGDGHSLQLTFTEKDSSVYVQNVTLTVDLKEFKDANSTETRVDHLNDQTLFKASASHSYLCKKSTDASINNDTIKFTDVQLEAFKTSKKDDDTFSLAEDCDGDLSSIVPIAVGCALAGLVLIVLIAYVVGRRHKRQRGYESV